ncbi:4-coumarate--CoA ligase 3 [Emericellopsis cladophorae]|uniref:4-coumarate--CoA ligase 3 n=1 Tax=Emericellopsis cladophorae TaxID=2686198 RepID=A0A9P9Y277_9HYPO|nr:4-coumarate--CoA ligase 3 [Emericellopsis cladophorae]KAI6782248.1 4-coumarate--CoA ligase 3 [Emericellopsis cladophorae]
MILGPPATVAQLPFTPPDSVPIHDFLLGQVSEQYGRHPLDDSLPPFICGITGTSYSVAQVEQRVEALARTLAADLQWGGSLDNVDEMDRVTAFFALNSIDTLTASWAVHRLSGVACPISPTYSTQQVADQLRNTKAKFLFTSAPLIESALAAASLVGLPLSHVYVLRVPAKATKGVEIPPELKTVDKAIEEGAELPPLPRNSFTPGHGARQKLVKLTHRNVIANILQFVTFERGSATQSQAEVSLGVLPLSHAFALIATAQMGVYAGHSTVILPSIDMGDILQATQDFQISRLWLIPPLIAAMNHAPAFVQKFDLRSVRSVLVGSASLSKDALSRFQTLLPGCAMIQGYGMTETTCIVAATSRDDVMFGSCGYLMPGTQGRLVTTDGREVDDPNEPGELLLRGPNISPAYFTSSATSTEMLRDDGWLATGDLVAVKESPRGHKHLFIVDRLKELIKVHGMQVAPAELEAFLLQQVSVAEVSVVPVPDEFAGELPRAYVVKSSDGKALSDEEVRRILHEKMDEVFHSHKRLAGGIEFVDALPKTFSGKILRSVLKDKAKESIATQDVRMESKVPAAHNVEVYTIDSGEED